MTDPRIAALAAAAALCVLPVACGSDDDDSGGGDGTADSSAPAQLDLAIKEQGKNSELTAPKSVEAGPVEISFQNSGKRPHDVQLIRVEGDHTVDEVLKTIGGEGKPIPEWLRAAGGLGTVPPGKSGSVTDLLDPGRYFAIDTSSEGRGGTAEFEVTGEVAGELPSTDATAVASEYAFELEGVKAGKNTITFDNVGKEPHHMLALPLNKGASIEDVKKMFASDEEPKGPPPVDFEKEVGTAVIDGGKKQVVDLEFERGKYVLVCFISDRKGGPPHVAKGMVSEATIE